MNISIPLPPVPASRPRVTRWATFYGKKYTDYKKNLYDFLITEYPRFTTIEDAISIKKLVFRIKMPKSWSKKKKALMNGEKHIVKPDLDNLEKALFDGLNGTIIKDDSQIWESFYRSKIWDYEGSTEIELGY